MSKEIDIAEIKHDISNIKWHVVGDPGEPPFENGWDNFSVLDHAISFRKVVNGDVEIRGMAKDGVVGSAVFTLPVGYKSSKRYVMDVISNGLQGRVDIGNNGEVAPQLPSSNVWVSLNGIIINTG